MKAGQKLEYIGKGFIGFHPEHKEMTYLRKEGNNDIWVNYGNAVSSFDMVVRLSEVKPI